MIRHSVYKAKVLSPAKSIIERQSTVVRSMMLQMEVGDYARRQCGDMASLQGVCLLRVIAFRRAQESCPVMVAPVV